MSEGVSASINHQANVERQKSSFVLLSVSTTFLALIPAGYAASVANSVTLWADFSRSTVEFLGILASWIVVRKIERADRVRFNYGYGKFEQLAGFAVAIAMFLAFMICLLSGLYRFLHPQILSGTTFGIAFGLLSILGNALLWQRSSYLLKRKQSPVLESQSRLFCAKTFAVSVVVISLCVSTFSNAPTLKLYADPIGSLCVAVFLFHSAYSLVVSSVTDLVDCAVEEAHLLTAMRILVEHEELYHGFRGFRSRKVGGQTYIQLFLDFAPKSHMDGVVDAMLTLKSALESEIPDSEVNVIPGVHTAL